MRIIVTGGLGFIGSHTVVQLLEENHEVIVIDNLSNSHPRTLDRIHHIVGSHPLFYAADCTQRQSVQDIIATHAPIEGIIHFAALKAVQESVVNPLAYYANNLSALCTMLHAAVEHHIPHFIFSSSATVYGSPAHLPVNEKTPLQPSTSPYGATKLMGERIVADVCAAHPPLRAIALRYFNPIGAHPTGLLGELPQGVPNNLLPYITQTAMGIRQCLSIFGNDYNTPDGTALRDYFHVMDLAQAHTQALTFLQQHATPEAPAVRYINVGAGRPVSVLEMVHTFEEVNGVKVPHQFAPRREGDVERVWAEITLADTLLNWRPTYTLADALQHAWKWEKHLQSENK